jgi:uncharacterized protein (TIGR03437 family)
MLTIPCRVCAGLLLLPFAAPLLAQLIPPGMPVPRTSKPPVVFVNGYQSDCSGSSFAGTFGIADQVLQSNGEVSIFFDNCTVSGKPPIEMLGQAFATFLSNLKYEGGDPVPLVDVVAHSMGGLIVRCYLSGKQTSGIAFAPPASVGIRKAVFLATPHFGAGVAQLGSDIDSQLEELASGSTFLFDLGTWNQGTDDLRGIDAVTAIGNGGTGLAVMRDFDDGVVALTSASLAFYLPGRTRVVPYCHTESSGLIGTFGFCPSGATGIAHIQSSTHESALIMVSFLNGTGDWKSVGVAAEQDKFLSVDGGLDVVLRSAANAALPADSVLVKGAAFSKMLNLPSHDVAYTDLFPAGLLDITAKSGSLSLEESVTLQAGVYDAVVVKPGPLIARVLPSASVTFPLNIAPGMFASIYGASLALNTEKAGSFPLPVELGGARVSVATEDALLYYASANQINAVIPEDASGLVTVTVQTTAGSHTVNALVAPAVPSVFTQDGTGRGLAAAVNARNNKVINPGNPLLAGDYVELFLTGLGHTHLHQGLEYADQQPTVKIGSQNCPVSYAGRAPGFPGLDQINCKIPAGLAPNDAAPVIVRSGSRLSNTTTVPVQ